MKLFKLFILAITSTLILSCSKDEDSRGASFELELSVRTDASYRGTEFSFTAKNITIDWGDGTTPYKYNGDGNDSWSAQDASHQYPEISAIVEYTIKISGKELENFRTKPDPLHQDVMASIVKSINIKSCPSLTNLILLGVEDMTSFDISKLPALKYIGLNATLFTSIDYSKISKLEGIILGYNQLLNTLTLPSNLKFISIYSCALLTQDKVKLENYKNLESLYLSYNNWESIDLTSNNQLKYLTINNSEVKVINLYNQTNLQSINIENSALTGFTLPAVFKELKAASLYDNQLEKEALNTFFQSLPTGTPNQYDFYRISIRENPGSEQCNQQLAIDKGWMFY